MRQIDVQRESDSERGERPIWVDVARSQVENPKRRKGLCDAESPEVPIVREHDSPLRESHSQDARVLGGGEAAIANGRHVSIVATKLMHDRRMDVGVCEECEFVEFHRPTRVVSTTSLRRKRAA